LNTVIRPPAEDFATPLNPKRMEKIRLLFLGGAEVLPRECSAPASRVHVQIGQEILALLERRPCSLEDLSLAFGISPENLAAGLKELRKKGAVQYNIHNHTVFYRAGSFSPPESQGNRAIRTAL
jgi:biotin operon repressor